LNELSQVHSEMQKILWRTDKRGSGRGYGNKESRWEIRKWS